MPSVSMLPHPDDEMAQRKADVAAASDRFRGASSYRSVGNKQPNGREFLGRVAARD